MTIAAPARFAVSASAAPDGGRGRPRSTERIVVHRKGAGWRFLSPAEARDEHVAHRLDPTKTYLDDVVAYLQHEETRRAFAAAAKRPELEKRSSFMKWVRDLTRSEREAERRAIEAEIRREANERLWFPFRNSPDSSADE